MYLPFLAHHMWGASALQVCIISAACLFCLFSQSVSILKVTSKDQLIELKCSIV